MNIIEEESKYNQPSDRANLDGFERDEDIDAQIDHGNYIAQQQIIQDLETLPVHKN